MRFLEPSYSKCKECYSDPVKVSVTGLDFSAQAGGALAFRFDNGDHNMQVLLPVDVTVGWAALD